QLSSLRRLSFFGKTAAAAAVAFSQLARAVLPLALPILVALLLWLDWPLFSPESTSPSLLFSTGALLLLLLPWTFSSASLSLSKCWYRLMLELLYRTLHRHLYGSTWHRPASSSSEHFLSVVHQCSVSASLNLSSQSCTSTRDQQIR